MRISLLFFFLFLAHVLHGQTDNEGALTPIEKFGQVRVLADHDDLSGAKQLARIILDENPEYSDVKIYLALLYGRQRLFDSAYALIDPVLEEDPGHIDALVARCALLYWNNRWEDLSEAASAALKVIPGDADLMYKKALAMYMTGEHGDALKILGLLLDADPENSMARSLKKQVLIEKSGKEIFLNYFYDYFREPYYRRFHKVMLGENYPLSMGTISPYVNVGHFIDEGGRFMETTAFQVNTDAYLELTKMNYLLLGYGIGTGTYLPRHRAVIHLWQTLPAGWSVSAGARYFNFDRHYLFYAVGVDKYLGNYWFELTNYLFSKTYGLSAASYLTARRYLGNEKSFLSATMGYGTSPDEPISGVADLQRLNAISIRLSLVQLVSENIKLGAGVGYQYEEFLEQNSRHRINMHASFIYKLE
ncbi:MAG: YaiO family outer membrane beta-barrel protein [Bacteroidales bacterium]